MSNEIEKLREEVLLVAKMLGKTLCMMDYNMNLHFFKGEELDSYSKLWGKKSVDTQEEIDDSPSVVKALEIASKFSEELHTYIKATKVDTADKAMEIAHTFIKKYSSVALPLKAVREGDIWLVDIDVGALAVKIAKVKVDAKTGDILSYEIPERTEKK